MMAPLLAPDALRAVAEIDKPQQPGFLQDLQLGLAAPPHRISPKYFYDAEGSRLFDLICDLPEYYPTRTERAILATHAADIAQEIGRGCDLVEFGAGSCSKVRLLLDELRPRRYLPIDISAEHLEQSAGELEREHPGLLVLPVAGDYTATVHLPPALSGARRVGFFPGSTIGNFTPGEALQFLRGAARLLRGGGLLLGADLVKDPAVLHAAYNDDQGVTAAFNLNLLARANRELGARFVLDQFAHSAFYNAPHQRIEMHLVSRRRQIVALGGECFEFDEGETLHTENSHKFTVDSLRALASQAGFRPGLVWTDPEQLFSVHWLHAPA
jgi:dimethylhistidine N-methyltransferase